MFLYNANEVMRIIGKQPGHAYIGSEFDAVLDAHRAAGIEDNYMFNVAIDFYLLGIMCGKRMERAEKQGRPYRPLTEKRV